MAFLRRKMLRMYIRSLLAKQALYTSSFILLFLRPAPYLFVSTKRGLITNNLEAISIWLNYVALCVPLCTRRVGKKRVPRTRKVILPGPWTAADLHHNCLIFWNLGTKFFVLCGLNHSGIPFISDAPIRAMISSWVYTESKHTSITTITSIQAT